MPVEIDRGSLVKIARQKGEKGEPMPEWASGESDLESAYHAGAGTTPPAQTEPEKTPTPATSGTTSPTRPARRPAASPAGRRASSTRRTSTRTASVASSSGSWRQRAADRLVPGSLGGAMIALFVYPVLLNFIEAGPAGAGQWIKAKFVNNVAGSTSGLVTPTDGGATTTPGDGGTAARGTVGAGLPGGTKPKPVTRPDPTYGVPGALLGAGAYPKTSTPTKPATPAKSKTKGRTR